MEDADRGDLNKQAFYGRRDFKSIFIGDLFYIFINCNDKSFFDHQKSQKYKNKFQNYSLFHISSIIVVIQDLPKFLRGYDLFHSYIYLIGLLYFD